MPHEDTENFRLDEDDDEDGDETEAPPPVAASAPSPPAKKPRKKNNGAYAVGVGTPPKFEPHYQEAELLWPEALAYINRRGWSAYDFSCRVSRLQPELMQLGSAFECSAITGTEDGSVTPGDALIEYVTEHYHLPLSQGPQRYDITFVRKVGAEIFTRGRLSLPSASEIMAMRAAKMRMQAAKPTTAPTATGIGAPPPYMQPPPSPPTYAQPQYQPPQNMSSSDEVAYLRQQLQSRDKQNEEMRQEVLTAAKEGRQAVIPPVSPPLASSEDALLDRLASKLLKRLGIAENTPTQAAVGVGAPPAQLAKETNEAVNSFTAMVNNFKQAKAAVKQVEELFGGVGDDYEDEPEVKAPVVATPEKKEDILPFETQEVPGAKWSNGNPVQFARNRDTGGIDWMGAAFANPQVAEKVVDVANRVGEAIAGAAQRFLARQGGEAPAPTQQLPPGVGNASGSNTGGTPSI